MTKVTYYLNWMGPINAKWLYKNGQDWSSGRIDIQDGSDYGSEWAMPVVTNSTWYAFREFLAGLATEGTYTYDMLIAAFEQEGGVVEYWPVPEVFDDPRS